MATYNGDWATRQSDEQGYAYATLLKALGHPPSDAQLSQATAAYQSGDPHRPNVAQGDAFVYQMVGNQTNSDTAKPQYDAVNQQFKTVLGRDATQEEKDHFGSLLANGQVDQYGLQDWLKQLPESVQKQDATFRTSLTSDLQKQDEQYYNEKVLPGIAQNFAKQGRSFDSSGYAQALAQAATGQNRDREAFLANLTSSQYGGSQANARADYMNNMARNYQVSDALTARSNAISDFSAQKQAYDQYLQKYGKRSGNMGTIGSLAGMGIGALFAAPTGGMSIPAGAALGGALGGAGGNIWDSYSRRA